MKMKILTIATFILIATLAITTSGQVKSVAATNRTGNQKPVSSSNTVGASSNTVANVSAATNPAVSSQIYRVGVRDVLDIQLTNNSSSSSTLFTVLEGGLLEYPFAGDPIVVAGLTTSQIAALLRQRIKIFDNPTVAVHVRDYASHAVTVSGFVAAPGTRTLRREAVPLYTILAETQVLPEAVRATVIRQGQAPFIVDLQNANLSSTLVVSGDAIKVSGMSAGPIEFFFIGGEIVSPGQKSYHPGLTLTQAILASGGTSTSAGSRVRVSRQRADGKLATEEYNLRNIQTGKTPDPALQKGDRIEVTNAN
jgi:protein involved in polysaccharide export with SLBB domain